MQHTVIDVLLPPETASIVSVSKQTPNWVTPPTSIDLRGALHRKLILTRISELSQNINHSSGKAIIYFAHVYTNSCRRWFHRMAYHLKLVTQQKKKNVLVITKLLIALASPKKCAEMLYLLKRNSATEMLRLYHWFPISFNKRVGVKETVIFKWLAW